MTVFNIVHSVYLFMLYGQTCLNDNLFVIVMKTNDNKYDERGYIV